MNWKHWPYWLKGGAIGGGVTFVYTILISYICPLFPAWGGGFQCGAIVFIFGPLYPITLLMDVMGPIFPYWKYPSMYGEIETIVLAFIIGAVVGAIISHFKSNKKSPQ